MNLGNYMRSAARSTFSFLTAQRRSALLYTVVGILTATFAFIVLGWGFISGQGDYWHHPLFDAGAHVSGWLFYKEDAWRFPLFDTVRMGYPDGTSIILTDSLPLVAIVAKLLGVGLLGNLQYFGIFVVVAYVLNALALLWTLGQCGVRNWLAAAVSVVFACFTTLYNIQFESFYAQFVVVASIGFYVRLYKEVSRRDLAIFGGMTAASLLIHPYIFAMSAAFFAITLLTLFLRSSMELREVALWFVGFLGVVGALVFVSGYVTHSATGYQEHLYGMAATALDLTAPFDRTYSVNEIGTYLGLGFWLLLAGGVWVVVRRKGAAQLLRAHWPLVVLGVGFLLFALSNTLYVHGQAIAHVALPAALANAAEMLRASRRFIVPVYYILVVLSVVLLVRRRSVLAVGVVVVALLAQVVDTSYFVGNVYASARQGQTPVLEDKDWQKIVAKADVMQIFPSYSCLFNYRTTPLSDKQWTVSQEFYQIAAREGKISNSIRASRRTKDCNAEAQAAQSSLKPHELRVYLKDTSDALILQPPQDCKERLQKFTYGSYCMY